MNKELEEFINNFISNNYIKNDYDFYYLMCSIIKYMCGSLDAHTSIVMNNTNCYPLSIQALNEKIYVTKYTDPGIQEKSIETFIPTQEIAELINSDPNIVTTAREALKARYTTGLKNVNSVKNGLERNDENVKTKTDESIQTTQQNRKQYLESLTTPATTSTTSTTSTTK